MQAPPEPEVPETDETPVKGLTDKAAETYRWWDNLATINAEDPFLVGVAKIGVRLIGILILLALSPFIIVGLFVAFIAVL